MGPGDRFDVGFILGIKRRFPLAVDKHPGQPSCLSVYLTVYHQPPGDWAGPGRLGETREDRVTEEFGVQALRMESTPSWYR